MTADQRVTEAAYFRTAIDKWNSASYAVSTANSLAAQAEDIPELWPDHGDLNAAIKKLNVLATTIQENLLNEGGLVVMGVATTLRQVAFEYVVREAENEEEAKRLEGML